MSGGVILQPLHVHVYTVNIELYKIVCWRWIKILATVRQRGILSVLLDGQTTGDTFCPTGRSDNGGYFLSYWTVRQRGILSVLLDGQTTGDTFCPTGRSDNGGYFLSYWTVRQRGILFVLLDSRWQCWT